MIKVILHGEDAGRGRWEWAAWLEQPGGVVVWLCRGVSRQPLLDACRTIKRLHAVTADGEIGLYRSGMDTPCMVTTVEHGAGVTVDETGPRFAKWKPHPRSQ